MKTTIALFIWLLSLSTFAATVPTSTNVFYASSLGADTSGNNESTRFLQRALDFASNNTVAIQLVIDGNVLVGTNRFGYVPPDAALHLYSNTKLIVLPGGKLKLANGSNCRILANSCNGYFMNQSNIWVEGYFDCNGQNQSTNENSAPIYNVWPYYTLNGMEFSGIRNFTMNNVTIHNSRSYSVQMENIDGLNLWNFKRDDDASPTSLYGMIFGNDSVHFEGNVTNAFLEVQSNANDDIVAFNLNEVHNQFNVFGDVTLGHYRMNSNFVRMGDCVINSLKRTTAGNFYRLENQVDDSPSGLWTWTNLVIKNISGSFGGATGQQFPLHIQNYVIQNCNRDLGRPGQGNNLGAFPMPSTVDCMRLDGITMRDHYTGNTGVPYLDISGAAEVSANNLNFWKQKPTDGTGGNEQTIFNFEPTQASFGLISISGVTVSNLTAIIGGGPAGIVRISGASLGVGTTYTCPGYGNGGVFTNVVTEGWGDPNNQFWSFPQRPTNQPAVGQAIVATSTLGSTAWAAANAPTITRTNFISGLAYVNTSGRPQTILSAVNLSSGAVNGAASLNIFTDPTGGTLWGITNFCNIGTTVSTPSDTYILQIQAFVDVGWSYVLTNVSTGAGNTASPRNQSGFIMTY